MAHSTRIPSTVNTYDKIQLARIAHVYVQHPDLGKFETFAADFGLIEAARDDDTIYYRGYGKDPYVYVATRSHSGQKSFQGGAFVAQTEQDFKKATKLEGAIKHDLSKAPGGGQSVEIPTPGGGRLYVLWGQTEREALAKPPTKTTINLSKYNTALEKFRRGEFQRFKTGPALVHKLGHYGAITPSFDQDVEFYISKFNFIPSDILYAPDNESMDVLVFLHLDLASDYSDHHCLFFGRGPVEHPYVLHHSSFEVDDFDTQLIGHQYLLEKGYKPAWGVGRHVLGSQIFDYWRDTSGFLIEHYADGDVVNINTPTSRQAEGPDSLSVWGPPVPPSFREG